MALIFLRSSHSEDWLPQLFGSVQYLFVETKSPFMLSTSSSDGLVIGDGAKVNTTPQRGEESTFTPAADPHWAALREKSLPPHPRPLTNSTLQTCPLRKRWCVLLTTVARVALVEQHRPRREDDRIGHQNDELLRREPAHVADRQPEAVPEEPEEQRADVLQVVSEPNLRSGNACFNFHSL